MSDQRRFALVGVGKRAQMYFKLLKRDPGLGTLAAICDSNATRMEVVIDKWGLESVDTYAPSGFETMLTDGRITDVIVATPDSTHVDCIEEAMQHGCNVISEKPLVTTAEDCNRIIEVVEHTGRELRVAHNCRYYGPAVIIKDLIGKGKIGDIREVHFTEWLGRHGSEYFGAWHRLMANSGGLLVTKGSHHFDLINWWLDDTPKIVTSATGERKVFGDKRYQNAERCIDCVDRCRYFPTANYGGSRRRIFTDVQRAEPDSYWKDNCVHDEGIDTYDTMEVVMGMRQGATVHYRLFAYGKYEGWDVEIKGTEGTIRLTDRQRVPKWTKMPDIIWRGWRLPIIRGRMGSVKARDVSLQVELNDRMTYEVGYEPDNHHQRADRALLENIFDPAGSIPPWQAGIYAVLPGIAANISIREERPVNISDLVNMPS